MKGSFNWYELMTTDTVAARAFYRAVVGWNAQSFDESGDYTVLMAGDDGVGGMMTLPQEACDAGARPGWIGYVAVADVDAAVEALTKAGGAVHKPAFDIPGAGRIAMVADPQGAVFSLIKPAGEGRPPPPPAGTSGHVGWHELHTTDWQAALAFYSGQFGWTKGEPYDMGPMGTYQLFTDGGPPIGGMMNDKDFPQPAWLYYFNVPDIDAAAGAIRTNGGQVLHGPHEVPGGNWIVLGADPQGAVFAVMSGPKG